MFYHYLGGGDPKFGGINFKDSIGVTVRGRLFMCYKIQDHPTCDDFIMPMPQPTRGPWPMPCLNKRCL